MIVSNKMLFDGPFRFPLTLMVCHTGLAAFATGISEFGERRVLPVRDPAHTHTSAVRATGWLVIPPAVTESASFTLRVVAPVGLTFAASVAFSNLAAAEISVPLAQMLKGMNPLIILVITAAAGLEPISAALVTVVVLLSIGVVLTATGELRFSVIGSTSEKGGEGEKRGRRGAGRRASALPPPPLQSPSRPSHASPRPRAWC